MATDQTIQGTFMSPTGEPLANGYLLLRLSHDGQSAAPNQVVSGPTIRVPLNSSGQISPAFAIYSNTNLLPANSFYIARAFDSTGTEVISASQITIAASPTPLDLATISWVPIY